MTVAKNAELRNGAGMRWDCFLCEIDIWAHLELCTFNYSGNGNSVELPFSNQPNVSTQTDRCIYWSSSSISSTYPMEMQSYVYSKIKMFITALIVIALNQKLPECPLPTGNREINGAFTQWNTIQQRERTSYRYNTDDSHNAEQKSKQTWVYTIWFHLYEVWKRQNEFMLVKVFLKSMLTNGLQGPKCFCTSHFSCQQYFIEILFTYNNVHTS